MTSLSPFTQALLDPTAQIPDGLISPDGKPAGKRFNVYRNNVASSLIDAMRTGFPVVEKLIGPQNFGTLALLSIRAHPPTSPVLMLYGADFPAFVANFAPLAKLPYLPDVARLDLARRAAYHGPDAAPMTPDDFAALGDAGLMAFRVTLHPCAQIVTTAYPIFEIWLRNSGAHDHPIGQTAQPVLLTRPGLDVQMTPMTPDISTFFTWLSDMTVGAAIDAALTQSPQFPLSDALTILIQSGCAARPQKDPT